MDFSAQHTWENYDPRGKVLLRLNKIRALIPPDVRSILDVGCGNGIITNALAENYAVTGLDPSSTALSYVHGPSVQASISSIPCGDRSFDLASCNEVLEHLSTSDFEQGISELKRVARSYLLIGVPHREQLAKKFFRCADCGHSEHAHGHLRSFTLAYLDALFAPDYERLNVSVFGTRERDIPAWLLRCKHRQGQWFVPPPGSVCPVCGSAGFMHQSTPATKLCNALNLIISRPRPYWLLALYRRKSGLE